MLIRKFLSLSLLCFGVSILSLNAEINPVQDSLIAIWKQESGIKPSEKLNAIQELLWTTKLGEINLDTAIHFAKEQIVFANEHGTKEEIVKAYYDSAKLIINTGNKDLALEAIEKCTELGLEDISEKLRIDILITKSRIILAGGGGVEAIEILDNLLANENLTNIQRLNTHRFLSIIYSRIGKSTKAFAELDNSYKYIEGTSNPWYKKSVYYNNKSAIYYRMGDLKAAIDNLNEALKNLEESNKEEQNHRSIKESYVIYKYNLASMNEELGEFEKSKKIIFETLDLSMEIDNYNVNKYLKLTLANVFIKQDSLDKAEQILTKLQPGMDTVTDKSLIAQYYMTLGLHDLGKKEYLAADTACTKSFEYYNSIGQVFGKKRCAECLYKVYEQLNKQSEALRFFKIAKVISDSLKQIEHLSQVAQIESRREFQEEIILLEEKAKQERKNKIIFFVIFMATLLLSLALLRIYYIENKKLNLLQGQNKLLKENLENKLLIEKQAKILKKQEQQKSEFLTNIAHELNTPLMIISGQSNNLLSSTDISQKVKGTISAIARNSKSLSTLIREIIDTTKNNNWQLKPEIKSFYFYEMINPIIVENKLLAREKDLKLNFILNDTQDLLLVTDPNKLKVAINNLLSNAIRYSKVGDTITINCKANDETLFMTITDNGIGIAEEDLPKIFDRFYQGLSNSEKKNPNGGFGIGLSICKEYIELLKGSISVESTINKGTSFLIKVPLVLVNEDENMPRLESSNQVADLPSIPNKIFVSAQKQSILIVEDNKDIWLYFQNIFKDAYNLYFTANGTEALSFLETNSAPNLIITDIMMPVMDGISLIETIKSNKYLNFIPILVVTARFDLHEKIKSLSLNLDDYIIKPFDDKLFLARIKYMIDLSKDHFKEIILHKKSNVSLDPKERNWLNDVETIVREYLDDVNLTPAMLADRMNLSQVHLDRKLKALIGFTASKYILEARLRIALELIEKKEVSLVKEVCSKIGYKSPRTFAKSFKQRFGVYPSELLEK